jgi:peptidase E
MAKDGRRHVLAIGGLGGAQPTGTTKAGVPKFLAYAAELSGPELSGPELSGPELSGGAAAPRICLLNTAAGDEPAGFLKMYAALAGLPSRVSHLQLFPMPNADDPARLLLNQDLIVVGGGSVANMLAVWRVHGLGQVMRQAWQAGVVLAGVSAGAICWFGGGTTDSFGPLRPFTDGLGLLAGSYCPHYNTEPDRRPRYQGLVADGSLPPGLACDDGAAAHFIDDDLAEIVTDRPGAQGYRIEPTAGGTVAETPLPARLLGD